MIWWEKYRPKTLEDYSLPEETRTRIEKEFQKEIPNLLLCGVQGTGKTTLARIIVQDILKCDYLYINASDENGIDNIRTKVSGFAQTKSFDGGIKVIILDEADFLSASAMAALRSTMESYLDYTRFILTGNYKHKIIPAIQSRCESLDLQPQLKDILKRCLWVLQQENIQVSNDQKKLLVGLVREHYPDFRKCLSELQRNCIDGVLSIGVRKSSSELCSYVFSEIQRGETLRLRKYLIENDDLFSNDYEQLLRNLLNYIYNQNIDDVKKKSMILTLADHIWKMGGVIDKEINCFACLIQLEQ